MHEATEARIGGFLVLLVGLALAAGGCGPSANPDLKVDKNKSIKQMPLAESFAHGFLQALMNGKANPDLLTVSFMKKIARPSDMKDKELGYDPKKVEDYLKKMGQGKYADHLSLIDTATGPFIFGRVTNEAGATEGFVLRLVPEPSNSTWKIDLFYRSRFVTDTYAADYPGPNLIGEQLAARCFIESMLGGDLQIAEALLSKSWKVKNGWSVVDTEGYSPQLVQQKLRGWRGDYSEYSFARRQVTAGKPAEFEITATKGDKKETFTLTVNKDASGEWLVEDVKVKSEMK